MDIHHQAQAKRPDNADIAMLVNIPKYDTDDQEVGDPAEVSKR